MKREKKTRCIGILTSGGDSPGLNAAIRAVVKTAIGQYGMNVIGFLDGFRGLVENRCINIDDRTASGILTRGGTILGTSRDKPHKMPIGGKSYDLTMRALANAREHHIDGLICLGGGGTQKNALRLTKVGIPIITLPKTIDNDVALTDISFGYDTARSIATEALDRLHTTATSHHRIIICELMGHRAGWLALGAGVAAGADVILIPEIPYQLHIIADYLRERRKSGKRFSIIAIAEGAHSLDEMKLKAADDSKKSRPDKKEKREKKKEKQPVPLITAENGDENETFLAKQNIEGELFTYHVFQEPKASRLARQLQQLTGMEARVTSLGHVQRGGIPTPFDRILCTLLGTKAVHLLAENVVNVMVAMQNGSCVPVPLEEVAGRLKSVAPDDPLVQAARSVGTCFGDESWL